MQKLINKIFSVVLKVWDERLSTWTDHKVILVEVGNWNRKINDINKRWVY